MRLKLGYQELIANAMAQIETVPVEQAQQFLNDQNTVFVDIRDVRELERDGMIPCIKRQFLDAVGRSANHFDAF
jgi:rhodanese-related sulfurtransferase